MLKTRVLLNSICLIEFAELIINNIGPISAFDPQYSIIP